MVVTMTMMMVMVMMMMTTMTTTDDDDDEGGEKRIRGPLFVFTAFAPSLGDGHWSLITSHGSHITPTMATTRTAARTGTTTTDGDDGDDEEKPVNGALVCACWVTHTGTQTNGRRGWSLYGSRIVQVMMWGVGRKLDALCFVGR